VLYGAQLALAMAFVGVGVAGALGIIPGLVAGYRGGRTDQLLSRVMDVWLAFPGMLLALVIVARLGPSFRNAILALGIAGAPGFFRLTRSLALSARHTAYVEAARSVGATDGRVLLRHILPNLSAPLLVLVTSRAGILLLAGGALSFLGLGAQPPTPEWGAMLAAGRTHMDTAPWLAVFPGICLTLAVVGFNLLGDGLRDRLNPQQ
jgi:peptide/nickel transport system permease protein